MGLNPNALVTLTAAKHFISPGGMQPSDDIRIEEVINRVSTAVERHCNRPLKTSTYTMRVAGPYWCEFFLRQTPIDVTAPVTVSVDQTAQTVWRTEADGDPSLKDVIVARSVEDPLFTPDHLYRRAGWLGSGNPYNVLITYTGGFATVPDDLQEAALEIVKKVWNDEQKGLQDVTAITGPGGSINIFDVAFPRRSLVLLERFRRWTVG